MAYVPESLMANEVVDHGRRRFLTITTAVVGGVGVGAGFESLPQAAKVSPATRTRAYRSDMRAAAAKSLPTAIVDFRPVLESGNGKELSRS